MNIFELLKLEKYKKDLFTYIFKQKYVHEYVEWDPRSKYLAGALERYLTDIDVYYGIKTNSVHVVLSSQGFRIEAEGRGSDENRIFTFYLDFAGNIESYEDNVAW